LVNELVRVLIESIQSQVFRLQVALWVLVERCGLCWW
jgi:hypothetical protein